jgi:signal transduction histidine kinase
LHASKTSTTEAECSSTYPTSIDFENHGAPFEQANSYAKAPIMTPAEIHELEEMALFAELARPLVHECNNFLNNLLLQLAISENAIPESDRSDWARVRQNGKALARLLQDWQRQRKSRAEGPVKFQVQPLIQEIVEATELPAGSLPFSVRLPPGSLWVSASRNDVRRLYSILLRYVIGGIGARGNGGGLEIECARTDGKIIFQIQETGPGPAILQFHELEDDFQSNNMKSLLAAAARSLTERLEGRIHVDKNSGGGVVLRVALPAAET